VKSADHLVYGALLLGTLAIAYGTWKGEEPEEKSSVVVFQPSGGLKTLDWDGERNAAKIEITGEGDDVETWVVAGRKEKVEGPVLPPPTGDDDSAGDDDSGDDDSAEEEPTPPPKDEYGEPVFKSFPGNAQARKLAASLSPLKALRRFDGLDDDALEQMGLKDPNGTLTITDRAGKSASFQVGSKAYGSNDTYLRVVGKNTVYLVSSKVLGPLRGAETRLMERDIFGFDEDEATKATVGTGVASAEFLHQGRHDKANAFWARPDDLETRDTPAQGFVEKLFQLRATSYPTEDEKPSEADLETVFTVQIEREDADDGTLSLARAVDEVRSKDDETVWIWWARTHRTRDQWVKVSRSTAGDLAEQVIGLLE
jgi:hypothetical protein